MHEFTSHLLADIPSNNAIPYVTNLIGAYQANAHEHELDVACYPEPYYGDYNRSSVVVLTHNPGGSTIAQKGIDSPFENAISNTPQRADNYHNISVNNTFPNNATNNWVNQKNNEVNHLFNHAFKERIFIRDLIPYHSSKFGTINFGACRDFFHEYFFPQIFRASLNTELYGLLNRDKNKKPAIIILARGSAWNGGNGLQAVCWDYLGRIYSNLYLYKLDVNRYSDDEHFKEDYYQLNLRQHDIYILAMTPQKGGRMNVYKRHGNETIFSINEIIDNYFHIADPEDSRYIIPNEDFGYLMSRLSNCIN